MRREYELVLIINSQLSDEKLQKIVEKYEALIIEGGETVVKNDWGVKKLAHSIDGHFKGRYYFFDFLGYSKNIAEAKRLMRYDADVLRSMFLNIGEDVDVDVRKAAIAKEEALAAAKKQQAENARGR